MPKTIAIEGVGNVEFPDSMDDAAISHAIETEILSQPGVAKNVPGTVAFKAKQRIAGQQIPVARIDVKPSDDRGYFHSLANAAGIPVTGDEFFGPMGVEAATNLYLPGAGTAVSTVNNLIRSAPAIARTLSLANGMYLPGATGAASMPTDPHRNVADMEQTNRVLNPMAAPMEQMGEGNIRGGLGSMTPFLATSFALPFIPGPGPSAPGPRMPGVPGNGMRINLVSDQAGGLPALRLPEVWNGPPPSGTMPVYGEPVATPARLPLRAAEYAARETVGKVPVAGTYLADKLAGKIARPRTTTPEVARVPLSKEAVYGNAPVQPLVQPRPVGPEFTGAIDEFPLVPPETVKPVPSFISPGTDFPMRPSPARIPTSADPQNVLGSPPLRPIGDWSRPVPDALYGDAPEQPINPFKPRPAGPDFDPRMPGGKFAPRRSIPLKGDAATKPVAKPGTTETSSTDTGSGSSPKTGQFSRFKVSPDAGDGGGNPRITWTDSSGSKTSGVVRAKIKSKTGPAYIVTDPAGRSRFVHSSKVAAPSKNSGSNGPGGSGGPSGTNGPGRISPAQALAIAQDDKVTNPRPGGKGAVAKRRAEIEASGFRY